MPSSDLVRSRRAAREAAFQAVYQCVCGGCSIDEAVAEALERQSFTTEASGFVNALASGAMTSVVELDSRYSPFLKSGWTPERLAMIDRLLLRLAVFELWSLPEMPPKVTITEYVKLAKRFGSADSGPFINAVLGKALEVSPKASWSGETDTLSLTLPQGGGNPDEPDQTRASPNESEQDLSWTLGSDD